MARLVAFLRGMNLGSRRITNDELAGHVRDAGFDGVDTYRASGNVILSESGQAASEVEAVLEEHLASALGYPVDTYVRSLTELQALLDRDVLWPRRGRLSDADIDTPNLEEALGPLQTMRTVGTVRGIVNKFGGTV